MTSLALFDFDGTLTERDNFSHFVIQVCPPIKKYMGALIAPPLYVAYKKHWFTGNFLRTNICKYVLGGMCENNLTKQGYGYAKQMDDSLLPQLKQRLLWHKQQGHTVVIVSASLSYYLQPWCMQHGFDVICNVLQVSKGKVTGVLIDGDCAGLEKVIRIKQRYNLQQFEQIYAYGDTLEDVPMLKLSSQPWYKGKPITLAQLNQLV